MPVYTVDLDCRSMEHDYGPLFERLRLIKGQRFMGGRWLIDVLDGVDVVTKALLGECAPGDGLFVTELAPETRWTGTGLGNEAKVWLLSRMAEARPQPAPSKAPVAATLN